MGRGSSKVGAGGGGGAMFTNQAFDEKSQTWEEFEASFGPKITASEKIDLAGYVATWKSFDLNKKF